MLIGIRTCKASNIAARVLNLVSKFYLFRYYYLVQSIMINWAQLSKLGILKCLPSPLALSMPHSSDKSRPFYFTMCTSNTACTLYSSHMLNGFAFGIYFIFSIVSYSSIQGAVLFILLSSSNTLTYVK